MDLQKQISNALSDKRVACIYGGSGVGKTYLACLYALEYKDQYSNKLFLTADGTVNWENSLRNACSTLNLNVEPNDELELVFTQWLNQQTGSEPILIIADNADQKEDVNRTLDWFNKNNNAHLLITTQFRIPDGISVNEFEYEEADEFLKQRTNIHSSFKSLISKIGNLPLTLELAASLIVANRQDDPNYGISEFILDFQAQPLTELNEGLENARLCGRLNANHRQLVNLQKLADMALTRIENHAKDNAAHLKRLLQLMACLPSSLPIPLEFVSDGLARLPNSPYQEFSDNLTSVRNTLIKPLLNLSLVQWIDNKNSLIKMHSLISLLLKEESDIPYAKYAVLMSVPLDRVYYNWRLGELALEFLKETKDKGDFEYSYGCQNVGLWLLDAKGRPNEAEPLLLRALEIRRTLGDNKLIAESLSNLGSLYTDMGQCNDAEILYEESLQIYKQEYGNTAPNTTAVLVNLGNTYERQQKSDQATLCYKRALKNYKISNIIGLNHYDTATVMNNLGAIYVTTGKYYRAKPLLKRALKIREQHFAANPNHPHIGKTLHHLGRMYLGINEIEKADSYFKRALAIYQEHFGYFDINAYKLLNDIIKNLETIEGTSKIIFYLETALDILQQQLGPLDPETIRIRQKLSGYLVLS